jgi:large subunit ribosomal protein L30
MAKSFRVKLLKGLRGCNQSQRDAIRCLGLRRVNAEVVIKDNPANRGQIYKVHHLVGVVVEK